MIHVLDVSWLMYKGDYRVELTAMVNDQLVNTGGLYYVLSIITKIKQRDPAAIVVIAVDSVPQDRLDSNAAYKSNRKAKLRFQYMAELLAITTCIDGVYYMKKEGMEADDLMYSVAKQYGKSDQVVINSGDKDMYNALVFPKVTIVKKYGSRLLLGKDSETVTAQSMTSETGVKPEAWLMYRALTGDKSDALLGVPRINRAMSEFLANHCTYNRELGEFAVPAQMVANLDATNYRKLSATHALVKQFKDLINSNLDIMQPRDTEVNFLRVKSRFLPLLFICDKFKLNKHKTFLIDNKHRLILEPDE